jgi:hypothetical protein
MTSAPTHPGSITYVDGDTHHEQVMPIAQVPPALRFVANAQGQQVPVVRVVATIVGSQRYLREYGPNDEFLRATVQRASPP